MGSRGLIFAAVVYFGLVAVCYGVDQTKLSEIPKTLAVSVSPPSGTFSAGVNSLTVTWVLNQSLTGVVTSNYQTVAVKLCYQKVSRQDRPWRKAVDELFKDKACSNAIGAKKFDLTNNTIAYTVKKDVPTAHFFVRVYVLNAAGAKIAYGESDSSQDISVIAITGRHASIDIAAAVFSGFSVVSLAFFFYLEKMKSKRPT